MPKVSVSGTAQDRRSRAVCETEGTAFPYTDRPRPVNDVFIFFFTKFEKVQRELLKSRNDEKLNHPHPDLDRFNRKIHERTNTELDPGNKRFSTKVLFK